MGKPEGCRLLGRPIPSLEDNIKIDFKEIGWEWGRWTFGFQKVWGVS
jgi:hypothetical protein